MIIVNYQALDYIPDAIESFTDTVLLNIQCNSIRSAFMKIIIFILQMRKLRFREKISLGSLLYVHDIKYIHRS